MDHHDMMNTPISLTEKDRRTLHAEAARTGRSISVLIHEAVARSFGVEANIEQNSRTIDAALSAWQGREFDGDTYVNGIRSGELLSTTRER